MEVFFDEKPRPDKCWKFVEPKQGHQGVWLVGVDNSRAIGNSHKSSWATMLYEMATDTTSKFFPHSFFFLQPSARQDAVISRLRIFLWRASSPDSLSVYLFIIIYQYQAPTTPLQNTLLRERSVEERSLPSFEWRWKVMKPFPLLWNMPRRCQKSWGKWQSRPFYRLLKQMKTFMMKMMKMKEDCCRHPDQLK